MGVHSLWDIVGPAARPVKLEALSRKKLAIDASIWIYQFIKAVRDKEGNSLGQTHIVGFFRRICKLLYFGILPLFVFDGGAPVLKRKVLRNRREKRQENQGNATTAAQKLLAMQLQQGKTGTKTPKPKAKTSKETATKQVGTEQPDGTIYFDDLPTNQNENLEPTPPPQSFRKKDEYHLPDLKQFTVRKGDQRIMPETEFKELEEGQSWDTVDGVNIDSVDPSSAEFAELPMATQYMILSNLRLRSRLRLGYTKNQLEHLFPDSRDFSKFQIQQVQKRNYYTQKLMTVSGMAEDTGNVTRRIAGDKDRQYMLVKNEGGWTLSLGGDDQEAVDLDNEVDELEGSDFSKMLKKEEINRSLPARGSLLKDVNKAAANAVKVESPEAQSGSDSDDFEDVPLSKEENDSDDDMNKALIESIYEQYEDDYKKPAEPQKFSREQFTQLDDAEMKRVIEESKRDYFQTREKEKATEPEYDLSNSLLFGGGPVQTEEPKATEPKLVENQTTAPVTVEDDPEERAESVNSSDSEEPEQQRPMPSWFNEQHLNSPHSSVGFFHEKPQEKKMDENEEAGLITWSEAKEYLNGSQDEEQEKYADVVDVDAESGHASDVEVIDSEEPQKTSSEEREAEVEKTGLNDENDDQESQESDGKEDKDDDKSDEQVDPATEPESEPSTKKVVVLDYDFEEDDENNLMKQLDEEENEHKAFTSSIQIEKIPIHTTVTREQLLQEQLQKAKRDSDEVTQTMVQDVQELLKRFGIPYITAPMEAEAQCAELYRLNLVDGIITDDSDCFLFGGSRIYKNMFNQKQYVECYIAEDIDHVCGLNQQKLIELALLLGSDYTEGVKGIGPVLAMEILAEFGDLKSFKKWFDANTKTVEGSHDKDSKLQKNLLTRIKNGKLFLADNFPDKVVVDAYLRPEVDHDDSDFKWGIPSLDKIRSFLMYNVGWTQERVDEVMVPLIRNMNRTRKEGTQSTIGEFFPQEYISYKKDVAMGKRMKVAANRMKKPKEKENGKK